MSKERFKVSRLVNFCSSSYVKISEPVDIPEWLDVSSVALADIQNQCFYQLRAVIVHYGPTIRSGHYVCFARKNEDWFKYNDSNVEPCTKTEAFEGERAKTSAYMLFYAREE